MGSGSGAPAQQLQQLLQQSLLHHTSCGHGQLCWQQWTCSAQQAQGVPLLLLHGGFGSWNHWLKNIPGLREQRDIWTVDLPGLGMSADMPEPHTPQHFAQILLRGINQLLGAATHFELAGFSFGAMIGARLAGQAGSRCQRFTAIGAAGFGKLHVQVPLQRPPTATTPAPAALSIHHANLRALMFSAEQYIDALALQAHADNLARHRFNSRKLSLSDDFVKALPAIKAQLVGVWGSKDATAGGRAAIEKRSELLLAAQPQAEFYILDGVGHWAMYEAPDEINRILLR